MPASQRVDPTESHHVAGKEAGIRTLPPGGETLGGCLGSFMGVPPQQPKASDLKGMQPQCQRIKMRNVGFSCGPRFVKCTNLCQRLAACVCIGDASGDDRDFRAVALDEGRSTQAVSNRKPAFSPLQFAGIIRPQRGMAIA
jgi:hypothetical protein